MAKNSATIKNIEVGFLVAEKGYAVQASYSVYGEDMQDTFDRETKALKQLDGFLPLQRKVKQLEKSDISATSSIIYRWKDTLLRNLWE